MPASSRGSNAVSRAPNPDHACSGRGAGPCTCRASCLSNTICRQGHPPDLVGDDRRLQRLWTGYISAATAYGEGGYNQHRQPRGPGVEAMLMGAMRQLLGKF